MKKLLLNRTNQVLGVFLILCIGFTVSIWARSNGSINGKTSSNSGGCNCHYTSSSSDTQVSIAADNGSFSVTPESTTNYTITVTNTGVNAAGIDIAVATTETGNTLAGTLSPATGSGLQVTGSELTHSSPKDLDGNGEAEFKFSWTAPSEPGEYYIRAIANAVNDNGSSDSGDEWNWMTPQVVTVKGLDITSPADGSSFCQDDMASIDLDEFGVNNVNIFLKQTGSDFSHTIVENFATANAPYSWTVPGSIDGGEYYILVEDASNANINSQSGTITIQSSPVIVTNPQPQELCEGNALSLMVETEGAGFNFQWKKDGVDISGQTAQSLNINNVSVDAAGNYSVVVSNDCGESVESSTAAVSIIPKPVIITHPVENTVCIGEDHTFTVEAEGDGIEYQWYKDGAQLAGETNADLVLSGIVAADEGNYFVEVSGTCTPAANSNSVMLTVKDPAMITEQPVSDTACIGGTAEISVIASGDNLSYQWYHNNQVIGTGAAATLEIADVTADDAGTYYVEISDDCGSLVVSENVQLSISDDIAITAQPADKEAFTGGSVSFNVTASGDVKAYQWIKDGAEISGETNSTLQLSGLMLDDSGDYQCRVTGKCNEELSEIATLTVTESNEDGPVISLSTSNFNMGELPVGETLVMLMTNGLTNSGNEDLSITAVNISGSETIQYTGSQVFTLMAGESADLEFTFTPEDMAGDFSAEVSFEANALNNPTLNVTVSSYINMPELSVTEYDLGEVTSSGEEFTGIMLSNNSEYDIRIDNIDITGDDAINFMLDEMLAFPLTIAADSEVEIPFTFDFDETGLYSATMVIDPQYGDNIEIPITANGVVNSVADIVEIKGMKVYPNPSTGKISIALTAENSFNAKINIFDHSGNSVYDFGDVFLTTGENSFDWTREDTYGNRVSSGVYYLVIRSGSQMSVEKITIE